MPNVLPLPTGLLTTVCSGSPHPSDDPSTQRHSAPLEKSINLESVSMTTPPMMIRGNNSSSCELSDLRDSHRELHKRESAPAGRHQDRISMTSTPKKDDELTGITSTFL